MSISTFSTLKTAVADWLDRDDLAATAGPIEQWIDMAEDEIYRRLRIRAMEDSTSVAIASGTIAVPDNFLEPRAVTVTLSGENHKLEPKPAEWIYDNYPLRQSDSLPKYYALEGDTLIFGPYPDSTYTVNVKYYKRLTALGVANETNWFTTNASDLLLNMSLLNSIGYLGEDERANHWRSERDRIIAEIERAQKRERFGFQQSLAGSIG